LCEERPMVDRLTDALAAPPSAGLGVLRELADDATGPTAGLLAAISDTADWEHHRRSGIDFDMLPLGEAIDEGDFDAAFALAVALHASIADRFQHPAQVREATVAIVESLTGTQPRH